MVFQSYALYPHMTVVRQPGLSPSSCAKVPKAEIDRRVRGGRRASWTSSELLDRKPKQLSGGQRQRVALGRAIVRKPTVFLMDEPLSNLDAKLRVQTRAELIKLQRPGQHDDDLRHPRSGRGDDDGRPHRRHEAGRPAAARNAAKALRHGPANIFVAGFIGSPSMNLVPAGLIEGAGTTGMLAGFRPEHVEPANGKADGARFDALVEVVEYLGDEQLVHLRLRDTPLLAKLDIEQRVATGEQATFRIPPRQAAPVRRGDRAGAGALEGAQQLEHRRRPVDHDVGGLRAAPPALPERRRRL